MPFDIPPDIAKIVWGWIAQSPVCLILWIFLQKSVTELTSANQKLHTTFEAEVKACEARYNFVLQELIKVKDLFILGGIKKNND
jgi:hypothetical protein